MFTRVLFPTDCSSRAHSLISILRGLEPRPELVCAAVVVPISGLERPLIAEHLAKAKLDLEELTSELDEAGIETQISVLTGRAVPALLKTAEATRADSILLGSYGKDPMQEVLKGSLSAELTRQSNLPVLSIRFGAVWGKSPEECMAIGHDVFRRPLHPTDMSECSQRALARMIGAEAEQIERLDLVHVIDDVYQSGEAHDRQMEAAREYLAEIVARGQSRGIDMRGYVIEGDPVADILRLANELGSSCIALGSHGKSLMREAVVGSVSQAILRMASRPILVMR